MIFVVVAIAVVVLVPLVGGSYANLASIRLRHIWLVPTALLLQVLVISVLDLQPVALANAVHVVSYVLVGAFVAINRHVRWLWVVGLGWASNAVAIVANGGVMPMSDHVADELDIAAEDRFVNSGPVDDARLAVLGDVFVTPTWLPLRNSFSVGDVVLIVGLILVMVAASRRRANQSISTATPAPGHRAPDADRG